MNQQTYYTYILANKQNGTLYTGVTNNLTRRLYEHKTGVCDNGFTKQYGVDVLVWYEQTNDIYSAILKEKQIKSWRRQWKLNLINLANPD
jgi:putative endonuclease